MDQLTLNQRQVLRLFDKHPELTVGDVVFEVGLARPTVKQVLKRLCDLGLLRQLGSHRGAYYSRIQDDTVADKYGNELTTVYKGREGFKRLFEQIQEELQPGDFYWSFAFKTEYYDTSIAEFLLNFHHELTRKGVDDRTIVHQLVIEQVKRTYRNVPDLQIRSTLQEIPTGMSITKNRIAHLVWGENPVAISISSPQIVERYVKFFEEAWGKSSK
jgi:predicted transcriptional regulator